MLDIYIDNDKAGRCAGRHANHCGAGFAKLRSDGGGVARCCFEAGGYNWTLIVAAGKDGPRQISSDIA
jgi:hypothetical protein